MINIVNKSYFDGIIIINKITFRMQYKNKNNPLRKKNSLNFKLTQLKHILSL